MSGREIVELDSLFRSLPLPQKFLVGARVCFAFNDTMAKCVRDDFDCVQTSELRLGEKENFKPSDSALELADPTPNIHDLFVRFDAKYFSNTLGMVQVLWSHRMTKCAGMCYFEGKHGLCKIALSAPLLSLRPRKDLVETLLHEMIHAYLFITNNARDRDDHGPEFHKHMHRINLEAGTNITVYHTFHDEVEYYQRHIWRCSGVCRFKKPFFGFVKRSMNRAPGPNDSWWNQHWMECGGTFIKVYEPEKKVAKKRETSTRQNAPKSLLKSKDIRELLGKCTSCDSSAGSADVRHHVAGVTPERLHGYVVLKRKGDLKYPVSSTPKVRINGDGKKGSSALVGTHDGGGDEHGLSAREVVRNVWDRKYSSSMGKSEEKMSRLTNQESIINGIWECGKAMLEDENDDSDDGGKREMVKCPVGREDAEGNKMKKQVDICLKSAAVGGCPIELGGKTELNSDFLPCPCCNELFIEREVNFHLDECLTMVALKNETFFV